MTRHINTGSCPKCIEIFERYPGFHTGLKSWFLDLQSQHPDAHISHAGRGRELQEHYFKQGSSRAHYGESAHNFNVALDIFRINQVGSAEWSPSWYRETVEKAVLAHNSSNKIFEIEWYGFPGSAFREMPHVEVKGWRTQHLEPVE